MSKCQYNTNSDNVPWNQDRLLVGVKAIARFCGVSTQTMYRWIGQHAFPAGKLPRGLWATTPSLIDAWLLSRNPYHQKAIRKRSEDML